MHPTRSAPPTDHVCPRLDSPPVVAAGAALVAVTVAVGSDVLAGGTPEHTATLGLVGLVVMWLRLRLGSRHAGLSAAITAAFLAQPVLHAAAVLLPGHHGGPTQDVIAEASVTAVQVVVAATIVVALACSEQLYQAVSVLRPLIRSLCRLDLLSERPTPVSPAPPPEPPAPLRWAHLAHIPRRGPPGRSAAPA